jgi:hypothetical protein
MEEQAAKANAIAAAKAAPAAGRHDPKWPLLFRFDTTRTLAAIS